MLNLVKRFPLAALPLIKISEKSFSIKILPFFDAGSRVTLIISASPFGFAVKYTTLELGVPLVRL